MGENILFTLMFVGGGLLFMFIGWRFARQVLRSRWLNKHGTQTIGVISGYDEAQGENSYPYTPIVKYVDINGKEKEVKMLAIGQKSYEIDQRVEILVHPDRSGICEIIGDNPHLADCKFFGVGLLGMGGICLLVGCFAAIIFAFNSIREIAR